MEHWHGGSRYYRKIILHQVVFALRSGIRVLDITTFKPNCASQGIALRQAPIKPKTKMNAPTASFAKVNPNPAVNTTLLQVSEDMVGSAFELIDATGKVIEYNIITSEKQSITVGHFIAGIYYIKIINPSFSVSPIKFVVIQ